MNVEIADEQIERLTQLAIQGKVNAWFNKDENKYVIRDMLRQYVKAFVETKLSKYNPDVEELVKKVEKERFVEQLTQGIAEAIADEFCDRYGD
jgi:hypothetical protein